MAPASCSLWPCCELSVTSCLSPCLFLALPEGPRGTGRGSDGSAADPRGYGPAGPGPVSLPASAASADGHCRGPRSSCRVSGPFPLPPRCPSSTARPRSALKGTGAIKSARRLAVSQAHPGNHSRTTSHRAGRGQRVSHMPTHVHAQTFTLVHPNPRTCRHGQIKPRSGTRGHCIQTHR